MKAATLVKLGEPESAFEIREVVQPEVTANQVLIKVEGFGLNYADVMARLGIYPDAPALPAVLGYEVVGRVDQLGEAVTRFELGQRVLAFTRFGGYAEFAIAEQQGTVALTDEIELGKALALGAQYCTAYHCAEEQVRLQKGDHVLIHAAAGGVGTALVQLARRRECVIYGTASTAKLAHLTESGVDHPIDYRRVDFVEAVRAISGQRGMDVIFDPIGGDYTRKGFKLLGSGGRIVLFGASSLTGATNIFRKLRVMAGFGLFHPIQMVASSKSIIGVNMLRIGDDRPEVLQRVMESVVELYELHRLDPVVGGEYPLESLAEAHRYLESRKSIGKIAIRL